MCAPSTFLSARFAAIAFRATSAAPRRDDPVETRDDLGIARDTCSRRPRPGLVPTRATAVIFRVARVVRVTTTAPGTAAGDRLEGQITAPAIVLLPAHPSFDLVLHDSGQARAFF